MHFSGEIAEAPICTFGREDISPDPLAIDQLLRIANCSNSALRVVSPGGGGLEFRTKFSEPQGVFTLRESQIWGKVDLVPAPAANN